MRREKSPLPGWDPYIQPYWRDVHQSMVVYTRDLLRSQLPDNFRARVEERVVLEAEDWGVESRTYLPDVAWIEWPHQGLQTSRGNALAVEDAVAEPMKISFPAEPLTEGFIETVT
jgi:hypothetical protein